MNFADTLRSAGARPRLTAERLRDLLHYDPETGVFTRLTRSAHRVQIGDVAGSIDHRTGYVEMSVEGRRQYAHRLAVLYVTGEWPEANVDHLDGDGSNNRWRNLRVVVQRVNCENRRKASRRNSSGFLGVAYDGHRHKWQASISVGNKTQFLGRFTSPEAAYEAYLKAKRRLHEGCTL